MKKTLKLIICICIVPLGNLIAGCGKNAGDGHTSTEGGTNFRNDGHNRYR